VGRTRPAAKTRTAESGRAAEEAAETDAGSGLKSLYNFFAGNARNQKNVKS
jgi:hypothetical protein